VSGYYCHLCTNLQLLSFHPTSTRLHTAAVSETTYVPEATSVTSITSVIHFSADPSDTAAPKKKGKRRKSDARKNSTATLEFITANDLGGGEYSWERLGDISVPGENLIDAALSNDFILTTLSTYFSVLISLAYVCRLTNISTLGRDHLLVSYRVSVSPTVSLSPLKRMRLSPSAIGTPTSLLPIRSSLVLVSSPTSLILFDVRLGVPLAAHELNVVPTPPANLPARLSRVSDDLSLVSLGSTVMAVPHTIPARSLLSLAVSQEARTLAGRFLVSEKTGGDDEGVRAPHRNPLMGDRKAAELEAQARARADLLKSLEASEGGDGAAALWADWLLRQTERAKKYEETREVERKARRGAEAAAASGTSSQAEDKMGKRERNKEKRRQRELFAVRTESFLSFFGVKFS
jgi:hypothetical protein